MTDWPSPCTKMRREAASLHTNITDTYVSVVQTKTAYREHTRKSPQSNFNYGQIYVIWLDTAVRARDMLRFRDRGGGSGMWSAQLPSNLPHVVSPVYYRASYELWAPPTGVSYSNGLVTRRFNTALSSGIKRGDSICSPNRNIFWSNVIDMT